MIPFESLSTFSYSHSMLNLLTIWIQVWFWHLTAHLAGDVSSWPWPLMLKSKSLALALRPLNASISRCIVNLILILMLAMSTKFHTLMTLLIKPQLATARLRLHASMMSICLSVCLSVAKMQKKRFYQKLSNLELRCLLTTYRKLCKLNWAFQRTHYWIPTIQDGWDTPSWKSTWRHFFLPRVVRFG